jgi:hypothetical protein
LIIACRGLTTDNSKLTSAGLQATDLDSTATADERWHGHHGCPRDTYS